MDVQQVFQTAVRHHHSGRPSQAKQLYQAILAEQPEHADALPLDGVLPTRTWARRFLDGRSSFDSDRPNSRRARRTKPISNLSPSAAAGRIATHDLRMAMNLFQLPRVL
jgi:hypothetical protein